MVISQIVFSLFANLGRAIDEYIFLFISNSNNKEQSILNASWLPIPNTFNSFNSWTLFPNFVFSEVGLKHNLKMYDCYVRITHYQTYCKNVEPIL